MAHVHRERGSGIIGLTKHLLRKGGLSLPSPQLEGAPYGVRRFSHFGHHGWAPTGRRGGRRNDSSGRQHHVDDMHRGVTCGF